MREREEIVLAPATECICHEEYMKIRGQLCTRTFTPVMFKYIPVAEIRLCSLHRKILPTEPFL